MHAATFTRPTFRTSDYGDQESVEEDTDLIVPLTRRTSSSMPVVRAKHVLARPPSPMIVDKDQLVQLARVLRVIPPTVPPRIRRLSTMVRDERAAKQRRARERGWLVRIGVLAVLGFVMFVASRPVVSALGHQTCAVHGWCAGGAR
jgi:hypothetical protein